jgi:hypothetical protein
MAQETPYEGRHLVLTDPHHNDAIGVMPKLTPVETGIAGKKCRVIYPSEDGNNLVVL